MPRLITNSHNAIVDIDRKSVLLSDGHLIDEGAQGVVALQSEDCTL